MAAIESLILPDAEEPSDEDTTVVQLSSIMLVGAQKPVTLLTGYRT